MRDIEASAEVRALGAEKPRELHGDNPLGGTPTISRHPVGAERKAERR